MLTVQLMIVLGHRPTIENRPGTTVCWTAMQLPYECWCQWQEENMRLHHQRDARASASWTTIWYRSANREGGAVSNTAGLSLQCAKREDQANLTRQLQRSPENTLVVCGCQICVAHRNLGLAWSQALSSRTCVSSTSIQSRRQEDVAPWLRHHLPPTFSQ